MEYVLQVQIYKIMIDFATFYLVISAFTFVITPITYIIAISLLMVTVYPCDENILIFCSDDCNQDI